MNKHLITALKQAVAKPKQEYDFNTAKDMHRKQWFSGKHKDWGDGEDDYFFPFDKYKELADSFVLVEIPINNLDIVDVGNKERVARYMEIIKSGIDMGPSWGVYGRFRRDGSHVDPHEKGKISVLDGNHRAEAAKKLGKQKIEIIMPNISYEKYLSV